MKQPSPAGHAAPPAHSPVEAVFPSPRGGEGLQRALLQWFAQAQRPLPWRGGYDPYPVWISEIMLQQTQVETMLPYFQRWMERFPDVAAVAAASQAAVLKAWEGLGYYARARGLHRAAREMMAKHGGRLPDSPEALRTLPGIGPYTAGAIASIAFNRTVPAVDGNVARVLARLFALQAPVNSPAGRARVWELAEALLPRGRAREFNQGLMELGALVCRARAPACPACPLRGFCAARREGAPEAYPRKQPRTARRLVRGAMVIAARGNRVLLRRRPSSGLWGGLWEFPWLERRPRENPRRAAERILAELDLPATSTLEPLGSLRHGLTHFQLELDCFAVPIAADIPATGHRAAVLRNAPAQPPQPRRWVTPTALKKLALARLSYKALELRSRLPAGRGRGGSVPSGSVANVGKRRKMG